MFYSVDYFVSRTQGGASAQSLGVEAFDALTMALLDSASTPIPATNNLWTQGSPLGFSATSASTVLRFTDTTVGGADSNFGLDAVQVVPEPATLSLVGFGLAGILWLRQRRRVVN